MIKVNAKPTPSYQATVSLKNINLSPNNNDKNSANVNQNTKTYILYVSLYE